ncbi:MAG TPA: hypothetical protein VFD82_04690 [Planctomycetota bacterium]|nr:hypothetical protein [Planctomycetota bacterium]
MVHCNRRSFLIEVGRGMITASLGLSAASQLAMASSFAVQEPQPLEFGPFESLVGLVTDTPADQLMRTLVQKLRTGTSLRELATAGALANARTFGGHDYVGFHTMMALGPAYRMALATPEDRRPLPLLKVLYRNTHRIQEYGGRSKEVLRTVAPAALPEGRSGAEVLRDAVRAADMAAADGAFAALSRSTPDAFNALLEAVQDGYDVHRVVMPHRAWDLLDIIGIEHAHTLLRQSVHYCVKNERQTKERSADARALLPRLLEQHKLLGKAPGTRVADDAWIESTSRLFFREKPEAAADAAAAALAEGWAPECIGEAIALATNQLLLRDHGRTGKQVDAKKPEASVHGDSIGVHACDSANAWRGMARAGNARNTFASLILGAFQAATDRVDRGGDFLAWQPWPLREHLAIVVPEDPGELVAATETAIRSNDQARACALVHRYGELGHPEGPVVDLLLRYGTSEDGALHAEKFFRTAVEEFAVARPAFRWRHLCALARVTASEFGTPAPGYAEAFASLKA